MTGSAGTTRCRSCGGQDLAVFLSLGDMPLSDGLLAPGDLERQEPRYPLDVAFCPDCALVQILETVPPEELFGADYPYFSSFTDALLKHSAANVEARVAERHLDGDSLVVELASNDGYLLQYYRTRGIPVLGIDPAPGPVAAARARGVETLQAFFGRDLAMRLAADGRRADVIHANNVLAHVADTNGFVAGIATLLEEDGVAVIEVPYVKELIEHGEFDTIYHEHLCYFSVTALARLFERHGLALNRVEPLAIHGGSLRLFVGRQAARAESSVAQYLDNERQAGMDRLEYYAGFSAKVGRIRSELAALLARLKRQGARIAGYGAAAKGTILLNFAGVGREMLEFVVDRNVHKQGRYIPGVRLPIVPPARILEEQPDYVLILPWNFKEEIMEQQAEFRRRGGRFIVPVPEPVII
ncbi:MAG: class I SAM-dependent methyltransferase [Gammaproteobacteria bacterium]|nr:class I SAM-dependent methyltransferase [Gammaproteobacteria bacterium]MDE2261221.1 class I SAM-dependent methyltransferase [Gammaproteobacteria bacterium]